MSLNNNKVTRALGQHMLVDRRIREKIISAANITKNEIVLEAGTGRGILTEELCRCAKQVISYEIDSKLYEKVQKQLLLDFNNLRPVKADLFRTEDVPYFDVFVSNLPYSRSRDAIEWLSTQKFDRAIVMVQEEFANKLIARHSNKNYRAISALAAHCFNIETLFKVRKESFEPQPKVESSVIRITPISNISREMIRNINLLFSRRNKKASSVAAEIGIFIDVDRYGSRKIDQIEPTDLIRMAELISSNVHSV
ncbi:MAG TPA: rRNA adenine N-6-methyltransferase family protein [Nitrososphaera sp.]|nr:rRNA adenine N-6-methyltransferase family protein [Nitrososphaera sp.]